MASLRIILFLVFGQFLGPSVWAQSLSSSVGGISSSPTAPQLSSQFWNPALISTINGTEMETQLGIIGGWLIYDRAGQNDAGENFRSSSTSGIGPNFFAAIASDFGSSRNRFGYATYFPTGVMAQFEDDGPQRYELVSGLLIPWHHQFTWAFKITPEVAIGVSGIYSMAFFRTELDVDLGKLIREVISVPEVPSEHPANAARAKVPMTTGHSFGGAIGVYWRPNYRTAFGASFYTPMKYKFKGELQLETPEMGRLLGAALPALGIEQTLSNDISVQTSLPAVLQMGLRYHPYGFWSQDFFFRYNFSSWEKSLSLQVNNSAIQELKNLEVKGESMNDAWLAGTVQSFHLWQKYTPGLHLSFYKNAAKERYLAVSRIDFDSLQTGAFLKYQWTPKMRVSAEYMHSFLFERRAQGTLRSGSSKFFEAPATDGNYRAGIDRFSVSMIYEF